MPALAVAAELRAEGARVVFVGGERAEAELVPKAGYELRTIAAEGLSRTNPLRAARAALKAAAAVATADRILGELRPDAVLGGGGYVAGPVGLAAVRRRIPLVLTEADSHLGLANRMLARFAARVCLAFPIEGRTDERYRVTGRPIPPPVTDRAAARARFGLADGERCVLVFGGSLGARTINEAAIRAFPGPEPRVLHAAGRRDVDALRARVPGPHYELHDYLEPFGEALAAADLCVARAGGSIFEIAAHGRPAILVPYPHAAADHQAGNARWMADAGAAVVIADAELTPERLAREVAALLGDEPRLAAMAEASARLARPRAARDIAGELRRAAGRRSDEAEDHADHDRRDDDERRGQGGPGAGAVGRHGDYNAGAVPRLRGFVAADHGGGPWAGRRLHLIGIGGAGMSGYARVAAQLGARVSGSDRSPAGPVAASLRELGVDVRAGHAAENVPPGDDVEVVYSSAVPPDNPERVGARERGLREHPRADLLRELSGLKRTIAVAGTHGKTTTTSMVAHALLACGLEPAYLIGGALRTTGLNADWGTGEWLVAEADESDRSMLALDAEVVVVTNVELDHHATFGSLAELRAAFAELLAKPPQAVLWQREDVVSLRGRRPYVGFDVPTAVLGEGGASFAWRGLDVRLSVPGLHNARNAAAALEACRLAGADPRQAAAALLSFAGAGRRFEALGSTPAGARVVDDYAHHPTEVAATIAAARTLGPRRLVAVFQPHLYSRTQLLAREFGTALAAADMPVVLDVYPARERAEDFPGVSGRLVAEAVADAAPGREVLWMPGFDDAERVLRARLDEGDLCLVLGAGDVDRLGRRLVN